MLRILAAVAVASALTISAAAYGDQAPIASQIDGSAFSRVAVFSVEAVLPS